MTLPVPDVLRDLEQKSLSMKYHDRRNPAAELEQPCRTYALCADVAVHTTATLPYENHRNTLPGIGIRDWVVMSVLLRRRRWPLCVVLLLLTVKIINAWKAVQPCHDYVRTRGDWCVLVSADCCVVCDSWCAYVDILF